LREGRSAELIIDGPEAGDWQLLTADAADGWDKWISDREQYLARRLKYDTQYYDRDIWGAEDLDSYGSWVYANDYGWVWRPHASSLAGYQDWAPYRHGSWVWCPPYGWTWVGYEPWGWAPYHYGRWVYHDGYWAWCPRSFYHRNRSWWRPALVAFHIVVRDFVCWYPLSYHHRDPRSRNYGYYGGRDRGGDRERERLTPLRQNELANLHRVNPAYLRAVTTAPASQFGSDTARLRRESETVARRVLNAEPLRGDLPFRPAHIPPRDGAVRDGAERQVARPARVTPSIQVTDRPTGATVRSPGVSVDGELRRTRVLNGRELRTVDPGNTESRPTGVVARPAPRPRDENPPPTNTDDRSARPERTTPPRPADVTPSTTPGTNRSRPQGSGESSYRAN
jgi:hypothetical protein